jgi:hypothetical protein
MNTRTGRAVLATTTAALLCVSAALSGAASAAAQAGGVKGSPQPELRPFSIGASTGGGAVALEPNGSLVVAYTIASGNGKTAVCVLSRGSHKCSSRATLSPLSGDSVFGTSEVFVPSANHVVVLQGDCCDNSPLGGDLLFTSTNGGKTFGAPKRIGTLGVSVAALVGGNIVFTEGDSSDGAQVESVAVGASGPPAGIATPITQEATDVGVGSYRNGALIAADQDLPTSYTTRVDYAAAGKNFDASASYTRVGTFADQQLVGMSGDALLTEKTNGDEALELRIFNGKSFGPAHVVPDTAGGGPEWFAIDTDPSGRVHVFNESTHFPQIYDLYEESTATGAAWSAPLNLGNAIDSTVFAAGLDAHGSGLVLGVSPAIGYPVLAPQSVSFTLSKTSIKKGQTVAGSGKGSPAAKGRAIELQQLRSGLWYTIATTHESASGSFSFSIKGSGAGTFTYRAVASDLAGYVLYGYSAARSLRVTG